MKKSRKKMLLSSIAMLLVALVALGSATFAWYITNATVTASTSQWSASTADGLVIRHGTTGAWKSKLDNELNTKTGLTPASITYGTFGSLYGATGDGTSFSDGRLNGSLSAAEVPINEDGTPATPNEYFLVDTFYVASSSSESKTAYFTLSGNTAEGTYLNIAVYVNGTLVKVLTSDPTDGWGSTDKTTKVAGNKTTPAVGTADQALTKLGTNIDMGSFTATAKQETGGGAKIDIVAFADGFNPRCTSELANTTPVSVTYSFTTNAPTPEP